MQIMGRCPDQRAAHSGDAGEPLALLRSHRVTRCLWDPISQDLLHGTDRPAPPERRSTPERSCRSPRPARRHRGCGTGRGVQRASSCSTRTCFDGRRIGISSCACDSTPERHRLMPREVGPSCTSGSRSRPRALRCPAGTWADLSDPTRLDAAQLIHRASRSAGHQWKAGRRSAGPMTTPGPCWGSSLPATRCTSTTSGC